MIVNGELFVLMGDVFIGDVVLLSQISDGEFGSFRGVDIGIVLGIFGKNICVW